MAVYTLQGSYSTVQVLSPTLVQPIVYCTVSTVPSGVIASYPVDQTLFDNTGAEPLLNDFARAIEDIMALANVVGATGEQTIDPNGLLADNVVFTVQYVSANTGPAGVTAEATVPVGLLNFDSAEFGGAPLAQAEAIINGVYANLKSAAGD